MAYIFQTKHFSRTHTHKNFLKEFFEEGQCSAGNAKNKGNSRKAIKSRLFNVNVVEQKLNGNEAYVARISVKSKCKHLKHKLEKLLRVNTVLSKKYILTHNPEIYIWICVPLLYIPDVSHQHFLFYSIPQEYANVKCWQLLTKLISQLTYGLKLAV